MIGSRWHFALSPVECNRAYLPGQSSISNDNALLPQDEAVRILTISRPEAGKAYP
jgi:hypothetical protein